MEDAAWKQQLRVRGLASRREQAGKDELSRRILARLIALTEYATAQTVMTYVSLSDEVHTEPLLTHAWAEGRRVVVPYCQGSLLRLFVLESIDELAPGMLGILEPRRELRTRADRVADPTELDLIVVPGVVFDRRGGRIGYGKGFYDGLLARVRPTAAIVALAFECQMVDRVPMLPHDIFMHKILTEQNDLRGAGPTMTEPARRIVITGVSRGLGRAMAEGFVARGHWVAGCARSAEAGAVQPFAQVDVSRDAEVRAWAQRVLAEGPAPDLLINNAAVINRNARLWEVSDEEMAHILDVNVRGTVNVIRHFVPAMIARGRGVIVNFSSYWGRSASAEVGPYCATKFAIEGLTQSLAQELPRGMAAVALVPGIVNTSMLQSCFGQEAESYIDPHAWAEKAVPFLLQLGPKDNGQPLAVPGGG